VRIFTLGCLLLLSPVGGYSTGPDTRVQAGFSCERLFGSLFGFFLKSNVISEGLKNHGYTYLSHGTEVKNVVSILANGLHGSTINDVGLEVRQLIGVNKTFFMPTKMRRPPTEVYPLATARSRALLIFDLKLLDRYPHHISHNDMKYGLLGPDDFVSKRPAGIEKFLSKFKPGEAVVYGDVSPEYITAIWVNSTYREDFIHQLHDRGISSINGRSLEDFVISTP
jgi:hypothetical protein